MKRRVLKYKFTDDSMKVPYEPGVSEIRLIAAQTPSDVYPTVWIDQPVEHGPELVREVTLQLIGTGFTFDGDGMEFVASTLCANGRLVWHVYRQGNES